VPEHVLSGNGIPGQLKESVAAARLSTDNEYGADKDNEYQK
jgi:hypothetical protein